MSKSVVVVTRCDLCRKEYDPDIEDSREGVRFTWNERTYELDPCPPCDEQLIDLPISRLLQVGNLVPAPKRSKRKGSPVEVRVSRPESTGPRKTPRHTFEEYEQYGFVLTDDEGKQSWICHYCTYRAEHRSRIDGHYKTHGVALTAVLDEKMAETQAAPERVMVSA